jgi:hypothetical protein
MPTISVPVTHPTGMHQARRSDRLATAGVIAGPMFVALSALQMPFHDGFDLTEHAFSFLLLGPGGWIQAVNFAITGLLFMLASRPLGPAMGSRAGRWARGLAIGLGAGMVTAGLFAPDPSFGYPPGTPEGGPAELSSAGVMHGLAFAVAMLSWCTLLAITGRWLRRSGQTRLGTAAVVTAAALLAVPATSGTSFATVLLYVIVTTAFVVTARTFQAIPTASY